MQTLIQLQKLVTELNSTNSANNKRGILEKYPECKQILLYTYNSFWKYGVTSKNCKKNSKIVSIGLAGNIFELLDMLKNREVTGHNAIAAVNSFVHCNEEFEDLIWLILDRNLKTRTDSKLINKVWADLIPSFNVVLANKMTDKLKAKLTWDGEYLLSRKLDGIRVITIIEDKEIKFYSRGGNEFTSLDKVKEALQPFADKLNTNVVLDGELCIINEDGSEDFKAAVSQIKRKGYTIENPRYKMFDYLTLNTFLVKNGTTPLTLRLDRLNQFISSNNNVLSVLEQVPMTEESFTKFQLDVAKYNWEGFMIRKATVGYVGKRTNDLLKVKKFFDDEYIVKDVEMNKKPMMNKQGLMEEVECLAAVKIEHKGNIVSVGSGWSDNQRIEFYNNPELIIGKTINVQYFEECCDKDGTVSLRFPTVKCIYENGRNV